MSNCWYYGEHHQVKITALPNWADFHLLIKGWVDIVLIYSILELNRLLDLCCSSVSELICCCLVSSQWWTLIYMFVFFFDYWWAEVLFVDRTVLCTYGTQQNQGRGCCSVLNCFSRPGIYYWPFQSDTFVMVYSSSQCSSAFGLSLTYCSVCLG